MLFYSTSVIEEEEENQDKDFMAFFQAVADKTLLSLTRFGFNHAKIQ